VPYGRHLVDQVRVGHYSTLAEATQSARALEKSLGWRLWVTAAPRDVPVSGKTRGYAQ
jgi:hypothetical protein